MGHDHDHMDRQAYYLEQICTIALSGALGGVAIMMYTSPDGLFFLADMFKQPVLWGGIVLLVLVAIRAITLWIAVGQEKTVLALAHAGHEHSHGHHHDHGESCGHEHHPHEHGTAGAHDHPPHEHGETCAHDHGHGAHAHSHGAHDHAHSHGAGDDHGHSHGGNYWRFAVLLLPVVLFFMNLPNEGFNADYLQKLAGGEVAMGQAEQANFSPDVGVKLTEADDGLPKVQMVEPDSPAARAGIEIGDKLVQLTQLADRAGKPVAEAKTVALHGVAIDKVLDQLKGEPGSTVKVEFRRGEATPSEAVLTRTEKVLTLHFKELQEASSWPAKRDFYGGRRVRVKGQYSPAAATNTFSLVRLKMTCCAADLQALKMVIESPNGVPVVQPLEWVAVEGQIEFRPRTDGNRKNEYVTVLKVSSPDKIVPIPAESDVYMQ